MNANEEQTREMRCGLLLLATALLSGAVLAVPGLIAGPLVLDEYGTYWLAGRGNPQSLWERSLNYENIPPLSPWIHRLFLDACGESEFVFRLPSACWYLAAIALVWVLGNDLIGPTAGGLMALVVAWHPNALGEIMIARCYALSLFLGALLLWTTVRWIFLPCQFRWAIAWCMAAGGLIWTHYLNVAAAILSVAFLSWYLRTERIHARIVLAASVLLVGASALPLLPALLRMSIWGESFGFQKESPFLQVLSPFWWLGLPAGLLVSWTGSLPKIAGAQRVLIRVSNSRLNMLFCWGLLPALAAAVVCRNDLASLSNPRYRIAFDAAAACLLVAAVCRNRTRQAAVAGVLVALIASWAAADRMPWVPGRLGTPDAPQWKQLAMYVQDQGLPNECLFVQSGLGESFLIPDLYDDELLMDFAACRIGRFYIKTPHRRYGLPFLWQSGSSMQDYFVDQIRQIARSELPSLWVAAAVDTDLNRSSLQGFKVILRQNEFLKMDSLELADCVLYRYRRLPPDNPTTALPE